MTEADMYQKIFDMKNELDGCFIAFVLYLFSKDLLTKLLKESLFEFEPVEVDSVLSAAVEVGFNVSVGNINGGLYAKYNGCIGDPSNLYNNSL